MKTILLGSNSFDTNANTNVLDTAIEYVLSTDRFEKPLLQWSQEKFKQDYESVNSASILIVTCLFFIIEFHSFLFFRFLLVFSCFLFPEYRHNFSYLVLPLLIHTYIYIYMRNKIAVMDEGIISHKRKFVCFLLIWSCFWVVSCRSSLFRVVPFFTNYNFPQNILTYTFTKNKFHVRFDNKVKQTLLQSGAVLMY